MRVILIAGLSIAIGALVLPGLTSGQRIPGVEIDRSQFIVTTRDAAGNRVSRETDRVPLDPFACYEWRLHLSSNTPGKLEWTEEFELPPPRVWPPSADYEVRKGGRVAVLKDDPDVRLLDVCERGVDGGGRQHRDLPSLPAAPGDRGDLTRRK